MHAHDMTFDWADLSAAPETMSSWAHNGIAVTAAGELIGFHAGQLVTFDRSGHVSRSVTPGLTEGHGITLVREGDDEYLWASDPGFVFEVGRDDGDEEWAPVFGKGVHVESRRPRVVKMTFEGEILDELPMPPRDPASPVGSKYSMRRLTWAFSAKGRRCGTRGRRLDESPILRPHRWSYPTHWRSGNARSGHWTNKWTLDDLPKLPTGKADLNSLRALFESETQ